MRGPSFISTQNVCHPCVSRLGISRLMFRDNETCETGLKLVAKLVVKHSETYETHMDCEKLQQPPFLDPYEFHKFRCI